MVGLGTFHGSQQQVKNYYLMIDSRSDETWLQCEGATEAFNQNMPLYPWSSSTTYHPVPCITHPICKGNKCNTDGQCTYKTRYASGSITSGIIAEEKFTLGTDAGGLESIGLHIGCGFHQENFEKFIGVVGEGKFSYCLETFNNKIEGSDTYSRFGADATIGDASQVIRIAPIIVPQFRAYQYYLNLEDISVGNKRVGFPRGTFELKSQKEGGTIIDTGVQISMMYKDHFDRVVDLVKAHFKGLGVEYTGTQKNFDVCFRVCGRFDITNYPSITLHLQQADYVITDYKANFVMISLQIICLGFSRRDQNRPAFILRAMRQANKRILYNVMDRSLSFATEYCELDS
ncbi:aspartyl protease AED1-like [Papaver somniferum]|uniref:aspartyl protease AED1-like n=1 Tax=Papaver somniferum TaxID=3469 RepID=UPI000E6F6166|nr:aspartyl protease AED1-like [Papaver somniferum]